MGSSIYQMGYQDAWGQPGDGGSRSRRHVHVRARHLSQALNEVRTRALDRLAEEARHVGADAVVGVETRAGESELGARAEARSRSSTWCSARRCVAPSSRSEQPVLTELSVADYALLLRAGIEPAGIVAWSSVFFASYAYGAGGGSEHGHRA